MQISSFLHIEFFEVFRGKEMPTFWSDIQIYVNFYPDLSAEEIAKIFCDKWKGYEKMYGIEFVERAIKRCKNEITIANNQ